MKTYDRFLFSLLTEFKHRAQSHIQTLWIDWMDLEEAIDEQARFAATERALRRIRTLRRAADASNAHKAGTCGHVLECRLITLTHAPAPTRQESFEALYQATNKLAEEVSAIKAEAPAFERMTKPRRVALVECCAD